jgi:hypothetical protein
MGYFSELDAQDIGAGCQPDVDTMPSEPGAEAAANVETSTETEAVENTDTTTIDETRAEPAAIIETCAKPAATIETGVEPAAGDEASAGDAPPAANGAAEARKAQEDEKRRAHDESEAKRKAEWEAKQAEKKEALEKALLELLEMSDENAMGESVKRTGDDLERLTRRNMKICVTEHIQAACRKDPSFARFVCHPSKSLINCFKHINKKAEAYIRQELELLGQQPAGTIGEDVPDGLCYQWAEDYFRHLDAEADKTKADEFVPKQYYGGSPSAAKKEPAMKKEPAKQAPTAQAKNADGSQLSLFGGAA